MELYYIYKLTNLITNQIYIGYTINPKRREGEYRIAKCKEQRLVYKSIKHYGWNNHKFEVFCACTKEIYQNLEIYFIKHYNCYFYNNKEIGLNLSEGGDTPPRMPGKLNPMYGKTHTKEVREKISKSKVGKIAHNKGIKMSEERYNKHLIISERTKIKILQYTKDNIFIKEWFSIKEASRNLNIAEFTIINVCKNKPHSFTAGGFKWKYA